MFKRALVSTSNKEGLVEFLMPLAKEGCEIVSTGGTSKFLQDAGLSVTEVSEVTGFPEVMDGRVRTLHPNIHMGLLARSFVPEDMTLLKEHGVKPFDLVVVNLYPFEKAYTDQVEGQELVEKIDIGGPSLLRAAAKSFERVTVVCDPEDYSSISKEQPSLDTRKHLASKVFKHCSYYDSLVAKALGGPELLLEGEEFSMGLRKKASLRYGENPHQNASLYEAIGGPKESLLNATQHQGKELSYNNILDLEASLEVVGDFEEPCATIIKHLNPCGTAVADDIEKAYDMALEGDPVSAFGGIVALNRKVTGALAEKLVQMFLECVVAVDYESEALSILSKKKNLRVLTLPHMNRSASGFELKTIRGGALIQGHDSPEQWQSQWTVVGEEPPQDVKDAMVFLQKIVRHVRSNAIVVGKGLQTLGVCGGQTNRVDSVRWSLQRANDKNKGDGLILASDAFFPFRDSIDIAAQNKVKWIVQPGGSVKDAEVIKAVEEHNLGMVLTGKRHFKH